MDFAPHTGQHFFFVKNSIRITNKIIVGMKITKIQKSVSNKNPGKIKTICEYLFLCISHIFLLFVIVFRDINFFGFFLY
jgi:hypothetical protein